MERIQLRRLLAPAAKSDSQQSTSAREFANAVAHELATPLTSTMLQVRGLRKLIEDGTREQRIRALDILECNVNRLGDASARIVHKATQLK